MERDASSCAPAKQDRSTGQASALDLDQILKPIHFVGLGGIGMSAIARILLSQGRAVSGSDQHDSEILQELKGLGAKTFIGHAAVNAEDAGALVVSTAISQANPELVYAREHDLPVMHRSDLLRHLSKSYKLIAVSGTHGKTTTTGMVSQLLLDLDFDPAVVIGGMFSRIGANGRFGKGEYFVAEADESDRTHGDLTSYISIVTNIEPDHLENYPGGLKQIKEVMLSFINKSKHGVVICLDDEGCRAIMPEITTRKITYGKFSDKSDADLQYEGLDNGETRVYKNKKALGSMKLAVVGEHNNLNALAAIAVAIELGADFDRVASSIAGFTGVDRRFQILGQARGAIVVDDYAHHPTEVVATLQAAQQYVKRSQGELSRVVVLFQPHQPGRLRDLWQEFADAFADADLVLMADVYIARGTPIEGVTSEKLVQSMKHPNANYVGGEANQLAEKVLPHIRKGDLVITMGAGDVTTVGPALLEKLKQG